MMLTCTQLLRQLNRQFPANSPAYFYLFPFPSEKVEFFARVSKLRSRVSYGRIVYTSHELRIGFQCKGLCKGPYTLTAVSDYNARYILRRLTLPLSTQQ